MTTPTHRLIVDLHTVPVRRATGGYIVVAAVHPVNTPPYVLGPTSDKRGRLALVSRSLRVGDKVVLTLASGETLEPLEADTEVLWALPRDLEVVPYLTKNP